MIRAKNIAGERVAEARQKHKPPMTQLELSKRLNNAGVKLDRAAVAKIENGLRGILDYELLAISRGLGVSAVWLLTGRRS